MAIAIGRDGPSWAELPWRLALQLIDLVAEQRRRDGGAPRRALEERHGEVLGLVVMDLGRHGGLVRVDHAVHESGTVELQGFLDGRLDVSGLLHSDPLAATGFGPRRERQ